MSRPVWFVALLRKLFFARFLLARATRLPVIGQIMERLIFHGDRLMLVPNRRTIEVDQKFDPPNQMVLPWQLVDHFIHKASTHWIMNDCICRRASNCRNHPIDLGCIFLGEAANGINPALGRPVTREQALDHARRCREEGLVHLIGRNRGDTLWLGVGPGDRILSICNCCACCCIWRMLPMISDSIAEKVTRFPGVEVTVTDRCEGCGACIDNVCFVDAIRLVDDRSKIGRQCRGCGRCVAVCPNDAIELRFSEDAGLDRAIARIEPLVRL